MVTKKKELLDQFGRPIGAEKTPEDIAKEQEFVAQQIAKNPETNQEFTAKKEKLKAQGATGIEATSQIEQQNATRLQESQKGLADLQVQKLGEQQVQEQQNFLNTDIADLKKYEEDYGTMQRLAKAGAVAPLAVVKFGAKLAAAVSGGNFNEEEFNKNINADDFSKTTIGKLTGAPIGFIMTQKIPLIDYSLSSLFKSNSKKLTELQKDSGANIQESRAILRNSITGKNRPSSDINYAIERARLVEEQARKNYNDAIDYLKASPQDIADGVTLADAMQADITILMSNRQMLERYKISKDPTEINSYLVSNYNENQ